MIDNKRGRPPLSRNEKTVTVTITVTESQAEFLKLHGFGNISLAVRMLVGAANDVGFNPENAAIAEKRLKTERRLV